MKAQCLILICALQHMQLHKCLPSLDTYISHKSTLQLSPEPTLSAITKNHTDKIKQFSVDGNLSMISLSKTILFVAKHFMEYRPILFQDIKNAYSDSLSGFATATEVKDVSVEWLKSELVKTFKSHCVLSSIGNDGKTSAIHGTLVTHKGTDYQQSLHKVLFCQYQMKSKTDKEICTLRQKVETLETDKSF